MAVFSQHRLGERNGIDRIVEAPCHFRDVFVMAEAESVRLETAESGRLSKILPCRGLALRMDAHIMALADMTLPDGVRG
jgi:hypothetical protein